jgi:hypothetical protein
MRQRGDRTGEVIATLREASGEKCCDYGRELEEELVEVRRKWLMEETFLDNCTLYDILRDRR